MKNISFVVLMLVVASFVSAQSENDFEVRVLQDGTLEITGYNGPPGNITIPGQLFGTKVSVISYFADKGLTEVTIANGIKKIERNTFIRNRDLQYVHFPDTLEEIGVNAFGGCNLRELKLPKNLTKIGNNAFSNAIKNCEIVIISSSLDYWVDGSIFIDSSGRMNTSIKELILEKTFPVTNGPIFEYLQGLEKITIPANWPDGNYGLPQGFVNFYKSQGKKGGVYVKNGPLWAFG